MNNKQKGFSLIIIIAIASVVAISAGVGYYVYYRQNNNLNILPWQKSDVTIEDDNECKPEPIDGDEGSYCIQESLKPIIYLYPTSVQDTTVRLDYNGRLTVTYPDYDKSINGWQVTAYPDSTLINKTDNKQYSYIFWEGETYKPKYDMSKGFVIKGSDTKEFLQNTLSKIGLTPKEYNEMIVFWLPKMQNNKYNLIHFAGSEYTDNAELTITPKPDSLLRVFMVYKPLNTYQQVAPQTIIPFDRKGFSAIEWGGTELR